MGGFYPNLATQKSTPEEENDYEFIWIGRCHFTTQRKAH